MNSESNVVLHIPVYPNNNLKLCNSGISANCYALASKEFYRGRTCINCANAKQLSEKQHQCNQQKLSELKKLEWLKQDQAEKLSQILHLKQIIQLIQVFQQPKQQLHLNIIQS